MLNFETAFGTLAWVGEPGEVFERGGEVVGWARLDPSYDRIRRPGEWDVAPPQLTWMAMDVAALNDILDWAPADHWTKHAAADVDAAAVLAERGFVAAPDEPFGIYLSQAVGDAPPVELDGYRFVTGVGDAQVRAAAHQAGWPDSSMTAASWREVMARPQYDAAFDVIAFAGDEPVGAALLWVDEQGGYCEFEPVGVGSAHRGRGVAQAMLRHGLHLAAGASVAHAVVGARGDDDYPAPRALYQSVGFTPLVREVIVRPTER